MPIRTYLKVKYCPRILSLKCTGIGEASGNVCLRNMGHKRIHKTNTLLVFKRKILKRIFGPTKERDGTWRIKTNDELNKLIKNKTIINYRLVWARIQNAR
jgi:hypothetical protein